jgi:hypothetical protein
MLKILKVAEMVEDRFIRVNDLSVQDMVTDKIYYFNLEGFLQIINVLATESGDEDESV